MSRLNFCYLPIPILNFCYPIFSPSSCSRKPVLMSGPFRPGKANRKMYGNNDVSTPPNPLGRQLTIFNTQAQIAIGGKDKGASSKASFLGSIMMVSVLNMAAENSPNITKSMEVSGWWEKSHQSWEQRRRPPCHHEMSTTVTWRPTTTMATTRPLRIAHGQHSR